MTVSAAGVSAVLAMAGGGKVAAIASAPTGQLAGSEVGRLLFARSKPEAAASGGLALEFGTLVGTCTAACDISSSFGDPKSLARSSYGHKRSQPNAPVMRPRSKNTHTILYRAIAGAADFCTWAWV